MHPRLVRERKANVLLQIGLNKLSVLPNVPMRS